MGREDGAGQRRIQLWDLPVRLVHWGLVVLLPTLWWTWRSGNTALHETLGYVTLGILIFRVYWGLVGSSTARFSNFVKGPREIALYVRGGSRASVGHNPIGALSVILLLGLMLVESGLGLFAQDVDGEESGALARFVSYETADWARGWHALLFNVIIGVVTIHVLAILFYLTVRRDNLIAPMLTGRKNIDDELASPNMAPLMRAAVGILFAAAIAWWISVGLKF